jgi:hypothetical protein
MARKAQFTAKQVIDALKMTRGMVYLAAESLGCSATTVYNYAEKYPKIKDAIKQQRARTIDLAELQLVNAVQHGEMWAVRFALETIGRERGYGRKLEIPGLTELLALIADRGMSPGDVFEAMVQEMAEVDAHTGDVSAADD